MLDPRQVAAALSTYRREAMRRELRARRWTTFLFVVRCLAVGCAWGVAMLSVGWICGVVARALIPVMR